MKEIHLENIFLDDWNIDFQFSYNLHSIIISEVDYSNSSEPEIRRNMGHFYHPKRKFSRFTAVPPIWAECLRLELLSLYGLVDLIKFPIEFLYNPRIRVEIIHCPHFAYYGAFPEKFWDRLEVECSDKYILAQDREKIRKFYQIRREICIKPDYTARTPEEIAYLDRAMERIAGISDENLRNQLKIRISESYPKNQLKNHRIYL